MKPRNLALIALLAVTLVVLLATQAFADAKPGTTIYRMPTSEKVVALTFDDRLKPSNVNSMLATLQQYRATATFFVIGQSVEDYPALARKIVAAGSRIANHTYSHVYLSGKSYTYTLYQIRRMEQACRYAGVPDPTPLFRSPGGSTGYTLMKALKAEGYVNVLWNVSDCDTSPSVTVARATANVLNNLKPGAIILMHTSVWTTPLALPKILAGIQARGYRVVDLYSYLFPSRVAAALASVTVQP